jgi:hypothetical protein
MLVQSLTSQCPGVKEALLIVKISESGLKSLHGLHPMNKPDGTILVHHHTVLYVCIYQGKRSEESGEGVGNNGHRGHDSSLSG